MKIFEIENPKLNWADETNAIRPENFVDDDYVILNCNIEDTFKHSHKDFTLDIHSDTGGVNSIGSRLSNAKQHFLNNSPMDLPEISYTEHNHGIAYINGRHRAVAAYKLGYEYIPMFVHMENIDKFKKIVRIKK